MLKGIEVNEDTLAVEAIDRVGPSGNFLNDNHTLDHFMSEIRTSPLFECYAWETGHSDTWTNVADKARKIAREHMEAESRQVISKNQEQEINEIVKEAAADLGVEDPAPWE
jgi:trimethylamine--corrinoid protein Co-methyltransferase